MKKLAFLVATYCLVSVVNAQDEKKAILVPSKFIQGARFCIKILSVNSDTLIGFADSGGGFTAIYPSALERLQLLDKVKAMKTEEGSFGIIPFKDVVMDSRIPKVDIPFYSKLSESVFVVAPKEIVEQEIRPIINAVPHELFLGQHFFMGKAWTFDYAKQQVWVNTPVTKTSSNSKNIQSLGFKKNKDGLKLFGHPSMKVLIDGDTLNVLFDTGATFLLSANGREVLHTSELSLAGSFIARSVFDRWRQKHPDWKVYEKADGQTDIIEVPQITIGSYTVGPSMFSVRPDEAWSKGMIGSMDKVVVGAVGGSVLKYFKVKADYNQELIEFMR